MCAGQRQRGQPSGPRMIPLSHGGVHRFGAHVREAGSDVTGSDVVAVVLVEAGLGVEDTAVCCRTETYDGGRASVQRTLILYKYM